jgi:hypothetical protein
MSITDSQTAFVASSAETIALSQMFNLANTTNDPTYVVLTALDRAEYTAGASGTTGTLSGDGQALQFGGIGGDGRGTGIVFTYQTSTGEYYNGTYGYLNQLSYNASSSLNDVANLSLFGTSSLSLATADATNAYSMMQTDGSGYIGSATVVTEKKFSGTVPAQATPDSIAAVANSFVGQAWNMDGCWVLASTIAAEAGASLPVQSTEIGIPGQANGEWIVAFNGPAGQAGNWQSMVTAGEVAVIGTSGGGGHITTCVSGSGSTAMLVDNATYVTASGQVQNGANDGDSSDIIVAAPHLASQEWSGVAASSVVIYELDTPNVVGVAASENLAAHASLSLSSLFTATDPGNKAITEWQVCDTATSDALVVGSTDYSDHSETSALTVASLSGLSLLAGSTATTDTVDVRAYNGSYWGDWQSLSVAVASTAAQSPPVLKTQTAGQSWIEGKAITLALPATTFSDPKGETLSYSAKLTNGQALPSWLSFNATTDTFSGTPTNTAQTLNIVVTATDTSKLSVSDTFTATVIATPTVTSQTANQTWAEGKTIALTLPTNTFTDPQGESLTYSASLTGGKALPSWLTFNAKTETFSGTAPATAQTLNITVTATDSSGLSASESFVASTAVSVAAPKPTITVDPTANQSWADGQSVALILPQNMFTDSLGLKMTFAAYETSGPNETSWLHFNAATDEFSGSVPTNASGTIGLEVLATDAQNVTATDLFNVTFVTASAHSAKGMTFAAMGGDPFAAPASMSNMLALHS